MNIIRLLSWNVNGLRAVQNKGFLDHFNLLKPDILCIQETKAHPDQLDATLKEVPGFHSYFAAAEKKGYSGVALYTRQQPRNVSPGFGIERFDLEGRTLFADYGDFLLYNVYFPNGKASPERLQYKMDFYEAFLLETDRQVAAGRQVIVCGDVNTAHKEIDLARPKENEKYSGFLPIERAWMDKVCAHGYLDTFRLFNQQTAQYSWWDMKSGARARNIGWRIDYFYVSAGLKDRLHNAFILPEVMGSDHCPVGLELEV
jgi:exodeoxyribonuclease III